jgi:hypothetical protein|tara:strand:+ start:321 stop:512 length:192 start_codon:yes stop_codon:yes gene_type:complete
MVGKMRWGDSADLDDEGVDFEMALPATQVRDRYGHLLGPPRRFCRRRQIIILHLADAFRSYVH